jgi:hypothetical protein
MRPSRTRERPRAGWVERGHATIENVACYRDATGMKLAYRTSSEAAAVTSTWLAPRYGVHAHRGQIEGAVLHLGNAIAVVARDRPLGTRVRRGSEVIMFVDYRP